MLVEPSWGSSLRFVGSAIALRFAALDARALLIPIADPGLAGIGSVMLGHGFGFIGQRGFCWHFINESLLGYRHLYHPLSERKLLLSRLDARNFEPSNGRERSSLKFNPSHVPSSRRPYAVSFFACRPFAWQQQRLDGGDGRNAPSRKYYCLSQPGSCLFSAASCSFLSGRFSKK